MALRNGVIQIKVSDNTFYEQVEFTMDVISEIQSRGYAEISTPESPDLSSNGLYNLLDKICERFNFDPKQITIKTANPYEQSDRYQIIHQSSLWVKPTIEEYFDNGFAVGHFDGQKTFAKTFGSFNNRPTWYRLAIVNYLHRYRDQCIISCNTSWDENSPNLIPFNDIVSNVPQFEFFDIIETLKKCPIELPGGPITREQKELGTEFKKTLSSLMYLYNDFFVDIVGVTFTVGDTSYMDEKEVRSMLCLTPFIIYGPFGHLESMQGYGFKTFGKWWNEDYDNYTGYQRLEKIYLIIDQISKLSLSDHRAMYNEMLPILRHNYDHLIKNYAR